MAERVMGVTWECRRYILGMDKTFHMTTLLSRRAVALRHGNSATAAKLS